MKNLLSAILFIGLLDSCSFAKHPIDNPPQMKVDARLLGKWKDKSNDKQGYLVVTKHDDYKYQVAVEGSQSFDLKALGYLSKIDNSLFLNIEAEGDSATGYMFYRILEVNSNMIKAASITDSILNTLNSPMEVKNRIRQNMNKRSFYDDTIVLLKMK